MKNVTDPSAFLSRVCAVAPHYAKKYYTQKRRLGFVPLSLITLWSIGKQTQVIFSGNKSFELRTPLSQLLKLPGSYKESLYRTV